MPGIHTGDLAELTKLGRSRTWGSLRGEEGEGMVASGLRLPTVKLYQTCFRVLRLF